MSGFGYVEFVCPRCGTKFNLDDKGHQFEVKKYMNAPTEFIIRCLK